MGQEETLKTMKQYPNQWLSIKEVNGLLNVRSHNTSKHLRRLSQDGFIQRNAKVNEKGKQTIVYAYFDKGEK